MNTLTNKIKTIVEAPSFNNCKTAFAIPGQDTIIDVIRPDGTSWHHRETLDQIRLRYPGAEIVNCDEFYKTKAARQDTPVEWQESTAEQYDEMLNVLPPAFMGCGGFLVGEAWDHHAITGRPRYAAFITKGGKYFTASRPMTVQEFKERARI